jgi:hypothetical protein
MCKNQNSCIKKYTVIVNVFYLGGGGLIHLIYNISLSKLENVVSEKWSLEQYPVYCLAILLFLRYLLTNWLIYLYRVMDVLIRKINL